MKLNINKENIMKLFGGDQIYKIYRGEQLEETKKARQNKYDTSNKNKKAHGLNRQAINKRIAQEILLLSKYYCPIDTGLLRDGTISYKDEQGVIHQHNSNSGGTLVRSHGRGYEILYKAEYAAYVHEIPYYKHDAPTKYKFLEDAAIQVAQKYIADYGYKVNIKMTYYPLACYVDCDNVPGESLWDITGRQEKQTDEYFASRIMTAFLNDEDLSYYGISDIDQEFLDNYIIYWSEWNEFYKREITFEDIIKDWLVRTRHTERIPRNGKDLWPFIRISRGF